MLEHTGSMPNSTLAKLDMSVTSLENLEIYVYI